MDHHQKLILQLFWVEKELIEEERVPTLPLALEALEPLVVGVVEPFKVVEVEDVLDHPLAYSYAWLDLLP